MRICVLAVAALLLSGCSHAALPHNASLPGNGPVNALARHALVRGVHPLAEQSAPPMPALSGETGAAALDALLFTEFRTNFQALDVDHDGAITAADFGLPDAHFHRVMGSFDTKHDGRITADEYYGTTRATDMVSNVQARANVSALGVGGHVSLEKAQFMFGVYLQDRVPDAVTRQNLIQDAFTAADTNHTKVLKEPELELALGILEARAELIHLRHLLSGSPASVVTAPAASDAISP